MTSQSALSNAFSSFVTIIMYFASAYLKSVASSNLFELPDAYPWGIESLQCCVYIVVLISSIQLSSEHYYSLNASKLILMGASSVKNGLTLYSLSVGKLWLACYYCDNLWVNNFVITDCILSTINLLVLWNKHIFSQYIKNDPHVITLFIWAYWSLEYYSYKFEYKIPLHQPHIILPYCFMTWLLLQYDFFIYSKILMFVMSLGMITYKLFSLCKLYGMHKVNLLAWYKKQQKKILLIQNDNMVKDKAIKKMIMSLPLNWFFYTSFFSLGIITLRPMAHVCKKIIRIIRIVPLKMIWDSNSSNSSVVINNISNQDVMICMFEFIQSVIMMYIIIREIRVFVCWKYYKILDVSTTFNLLSLHFVYSKFMFAVFTIYFGQSLYSGELQSFLEHDEIKPALVLLMLHYSCYLLNCWVVYYAFLWKHFDLIEYILFSRKGHFMKLIYHTAWVHLFCGYNAFIREQYIADIFHWLTTVLLLCLVLTMQNTTGNKFLYRIEDKHDKRIKKI